MLKFGLATAKERIITVSHTPAKLKNLQSVY